MSSSWGVYSPIANTVFNNKVLVGFQNFGAGPVSSNPIDLTGHTDVLLAVTVPPGALSGTTPGIQVQIDGLDPNGNPIPAVVKTAVLTGPGTVAVSGGLHTSGTVLPASAQVTVTMTGTTPAAAGIGITVTGR